MFNPDRAAALQEMGPAGASEKITRRCLERACMNFRSLLMSGFSQKKRETVKPSAEHSLIQDVSL